MVDTKECGMCGNTIGFAFGTCVQCGYNDLDKTFRWIQVQVSSLPQPLRDRLVKDHVKRYRKCYQKDEEWAEIVKEVLG